MGNGSPTNPVAVPPSPPWGADVARGTGLSTRCQACGDRPWQGYALMRSPDNWVYEIVANKGPFTEPSHVHVLHMALMDNRV
jgi:hypothetical protein